jgi:hypothetical protein
MEEGTGGAGLARLLVVVFVLESWRGLLFVFTEREGLGLVRFVFVRLAGFGVGRLAGSAETPLVMLRQIPVRGSRRKPSPLGPPPHRDDGERAKAGEKSPWF